MTRHSGISIDDDGVTLVITSEAPGAGATEVAFAPALLVLGTNGQPVAGRRARRLAAAGTGAAFTDFTLRVGDPVPVVGSDGSARSAADLVALTITCLLRDQASPQDPDQCMAIAHPTGWSAYQLSELRGALTRAGLDGLATAFVPRAVAVLHTTGGGRADAVVVADLGRHHTEITTLRGTVVDGVRTDDLGTAELDRVVMSHVLGQLAGQLSDRDDLTSRCRAARRELTGAPAAVVEVSTTAGIQRMRVTRAEFEDAIRESVSVAASNIYRALGDAAEKGAATYDVVIVGDGADVPLLSQILSAEAGFGPDVAAGTAIPATGAALIAGDRARSARAGRQRMAARAQQPTPAAQAAQYQALRLAPTPRHDWPTTPPQRSGGRARTAIVAAAAGLAVLVGGVAVTSGGGHGGGGGYHASRF